MSSTGRFISLIELHSSIEDPTEIHVFKDGRGDSWYPNGYTLSVTSVDGPDPIYSTLEEENTLTIFFENIKALNKRQVTIEIIPK